MFEFDMLSNGTQGEFRRTTVEEANSLLKSRMHLPFSMVCGVRNTALQSHLLRARGGHQRGKARKLSVRPRQIGVWQRRAPGWQESSSPLRQDSACRYDGAHSG